MYSASSGELRSLAWCICLLPLLVGCPQLQNDEFEKIHWDGGSGGVGTAGQTNSANTTSGGSGGDGSGGTVTTTSAGGGAGSTATQSATDSASSTGGGGNGGTGSTIACDNDGAIDPDEECDGDALGGASCESAGLGPGKPKCTDECVIDNSDCGPKPGCGDEKIQPNEECDGTELAMQTCETQGFLRGELLCSECQFDTSECTSEAVCDSEATRQTGEVFSGDISKYESRVETHNCADGAGGPDISFLWTAPTTDCYQISVASTSDLDALVIVYADCSLEEELGCDDDSGFNSVPSLYFADATAGTTYAVVVDSYDSSESAPVTVEISLCGGDWGGIGSTGGRP